MSDRTSNERSTLAEILRQCEKHLDTLTDKVGCTHEQEVLLEDLNHWIQRMDRPGVETTAPLSEADEVQIGRSQAELAVLKKDGRSYEVRRIAGQALEVITRLHAARATFGEVAQLRRIDRAARKFVDDFKSDALKAYVGWEELNKALFDGRPFTEEPSPVEPKPPQSWPNDISRAGFNELRIVSTKSGAEKASGEQS